ncbi:MAG: hypothetical protein U0X91_20830 [Spirosomataceae bacterium]
MKAIFLSWSQNRKAPNKAIERLRDNLSDFCQQFNHPDFSRIPKTYEDVLAYVESCIALMELASGKKSKLRVVKSDRLVTSEKKYIWLDWGTDNGGVTLGTITITEGGENERA